MSTLALQMDHRAALDLMQATELPEGKRSCLCQTKQAWWIWQRSACVKLFTFSVEHFSFCGQPQMHMLWSDLRLCHVSALVECMHVGVLTPSSNALIPMLHVHQQGLAELGYEIVSTGGSAAAVQAAGVPVRRVEELTGFPEMLDGVPACSACARCSLHTMFTRQVSVLAAACP